MSVDVEVDGKIVSGSSVIDVRVGKSSSDLLTIGRSWTDERGDAVIVDLGEGRNVVALLLAVSREPSGEIQLLPGLSGIAEYAFGAKSSADLVGRRGTAVARADAMPLLLSFRNINDPSSAVILDPFDDSFSRHFGPGVRFRQVRFDLVTPGFWPLQHVIGEPVRRTIKTRLPWLQGDRNAPGGDPVVKALNAIGSSLDRQGPVGKQVVSHLSSGMFSRNR